MQTSLAQAYLEQFRKKIKGNGVPLRLAMYLLELEMDEAHTDDRELCRGQLARAINYGESSITNAVTALQDVGILEDLGDEKFKQKKALKLIPPCDMEPEKAFVKKKKKVFSTMPSKRNIKLSTK